MRSNHIIEFSRTKEEAEKLIFGRDFKKTMAMQFLGLILFIPG